MKRIVLALLSALALSGCAGMTTYVQQHMAGIVAFTAVAGAVSAGSGVVVNGLAIKRELEDKDE